jgi:hypothetical protein
MERMEVRLGQWLVELSLIVGDERSTRVEVRVVGGGDLAQGRVEARPPRIVVVEGEGEAGGGRAAEKRKKRKRRGSDEVTDGEGAGGAEVPPHLSGRRWRR